MNNQLYSKRSEEKRYDKINKIYLFAIKLCFTINIIYFIPICLTFVIDLRFIKNYSFHYLKFFLNLKLNYENL